MHEKIFDITISKKTEVKTTVRHHYHTTSKSAMCRMEESSPRAGMKEPHKLLVDMEMTQPLWKTVQHFLTALTHTSRVTQVTQKE